MMTRPPTPTPNGQVAPHVEEERENPLDRLRDVLRERTWWAAATFVLVMAGVVVGTRYQPQIYSATGSMIISDTTPQVLSGMHEVMRLGVQGWNQERYYDAQLAILRSRDLGQLVVERNQLAADPHLLGLDRPGAELTPEQQQQIIANANPAALVAGRVRATLSDKTMIAQVSVEDVDPQFAANLVNWVMEAYRDRNLESRRRATREAYRELRGILAEMERKKNAAEAALLEFETQNDLSALRRRAVDERLMAYEQQVRTASTRVLETKQTLAQLSKVKRLPDLLGTAAPSLREDPLLADLKRRYLELSIARKEVDSLYLAKHPKVQTVDKQIEHILNAAQVHLAAATRSARIAHKDALDVLKDAEDNLAKVRNEDATLRNARTRFEQLQSERTEAKMFYDIVAKRVAETDLTGQVEVNNVSLLDRATVPTTPIRPRYMFNYAAGAVLALVIAIAAAFAVDALDDTVKMTSDFERMTSINLIGGLPTFASLAEDQLLANIPEHKHDLFTYFHPSSQIAEAARTLRTGILFSNPDHPPRTLLITSAFPREGKTTSAVTIAIALAAASGSCILVDTDLRKPRIHKVFDATNDRGITSYVLNKSLTLRQVAIETEVPGLWVLCCGPVPPNAAEILHTERFAELLAELRQEFENVVLDSSPVEFVSDALVLSTKVDGVIVVAQAGYTRRNWLKATASALRSMSAPLLGVVLSRVDAGARGYRYYYGRGKRGEYGYQYGREPEDEIG